MYIYKYGHFTEDCIVYINVSYYSKDLDPDGNTDTGVNLIKINKQNNRNIFKLLICPYHL